jgi:type IV pilus assembly protein PilZ
MRPLLSDWSSMPPPEDQRRNPRAPVRLRIDYERMNAFFADYTKNISKGGTFIKTTRPPEVGTRCQFSLSLPARSEPLVLDGEVAWVLAPENAQQRAAEPGMGVRFVFADESARREFERVIERIMEESLGRQVAHKLLRR